MCAYYSICLNLENIEALKHQNYQNPQGDEEDGPRYVDKPKLESHINFI